jgi:hypothetical protein
MMKDVGYAANSFIHASEVSSINYTLTLPMIESPKIPIS